MKAYESSARKKWTETFFDLKPRIGKIWLISDAPVIRMGGNVMSMVTSLDISTVKSENDLEI